MKDILSRFSRTTIIFLIVAGILILAFGGYLSFVSSAVNGSAISLQTWVSSRFLAVRDLLTVPRDVVSLRAQNAQLQNEVSRLQSQVIDLQQRVTDTEILEALVNYSRANPQSNYQGAAVIGRDPSPFLHYIIIDRGSNEGIVPGMPVVTDQGLVGRVDAVIAGASRVQLITDPNMSVNVRLQNAQSEAVLAGSISGDISLDLISQDVDVQVGDVVLTSGLGGTYPANLLIGQVLNVRKRESELFQQASVQPVVDFTQLQIVLVILDFQPVDITPLIPSP